MLQALALASLVSVSQALLGGSGVARSRRRGGDPPPTALSATPVVGSAVRGAAGALPFFDALSDTLPFPVPFERSATTYRFTRAAHKRLIEAALEAAADGRPPLFFHIVQRADPESVVGAIGCVTQILSVRLAQEEGESEEDAALLVSVMCAGRAVVVEETSSFPFSTGTVAPVRDVDEGPLDAVDERDCFRRLGSVAALSSKLEARGFAADEAEERLQELEAEVLEFQEAALEFQWSPQERTERAGFAILALVVLPHDQAVEALATVSSRRRLDLLEAFLKAQEAELSAKVALEALTVEAAASMPLLPPGARFSFFWHEDDGWFEGKVVANMQPTAGWYTVRWDSDKSLTRVQMDESNRARWRVLPK